MIDDPQSLPLFAGLNDAALDHIALLCTVSEHDDGDIIISEQDSSDFNLYILRHGRVEIVSTGSGLVSDETVLSREDKEVLGEISWLTHAPKAATVRCVGPVELISIDGPGLMRFMTENPDAGFVIMRRIAVLLACRLEQAGVLLKQVLWASNI
ncbi:MAG: cAMP-binding protein [Gammaproteobacteria bacterium]|nr:MAG: cAMP-binding protein [Gammaproteobacteria bacterium]TND02212.1 MAG: cAMP-binding protein [Gammaproteobacteria bacterium]